MRTAVLLLVAISFNAYASDDFSTRVMRAHAYESAGGGRSYLMNFMSHVDRKTTTIMGECFSDGEPGTTDEFTVVADIKPDGTISNVAVRPASDRELCYAEKLARVKAPPLPKRLAESEFPVVIQVSHTYPDAP